MISTTYEPPKSHFQTQRTSNKNIHLNGGDQFAIDDLFESLKDVIEPLPTFKHKFDDAANGHVTSSRKAARQRGLSISSGVSYTNFYSKVGSDNSKYMHDEDPTTTTHDRRLSMLLNSSTIKIVALCGAWYLTSVISSNLTKSILRIYRYPVTLTEVQFLLTSAFCLLTYVIVFNNKKFARSFPLGTFPAQLTESRHTSLFDIIKPTRLILSQTTPMGIFQFIGHITSHNATSLISVSTVHTIKALSPIVTVMSYRFLFQVQYPTITYLTLAPLMLGIMLTCFYKNHKKGASGDPLASEKLAYFKGLFYAFISMLIFVSQNIFAKKILTYKTNLLNGSESYLPDAKHQYSNILPVDNDEQNAIRKIGEKKKIDKLTILFYCSLIGFSFTFPIYFSSELFANDVFSLLQIDSKVASLIFCHGFVHFIQSLLAFHILGLISPVSYSIANIFKRIVVIIAALFWEAQPLNLVQAVGLVLTMVGLYCYDRWGSNKKH